MPDIGQQPVMQPGFGVPVPVAKVDDIEILRQAAIELWKIIDDIDTADDIARENDEWYRKRVQHLQGQRFEIFTSDGYSLFLPPAAS